MVDLTREMERAMKETQRQYGEQAVSTLKGWGIVILVVDILAALIIFVGLGIKRFEHTGAFAGLEPSAFVASVALVIGGIFAFGFLSSLSSMAANIIAIRKKLDVS